MAKKNFRPPQTVDQVYATGAFTDLKRALSKEHLNLHDCTMNTPKYLGLMLSTQSKSIPLAQYSSTFNVMPLTNTHTTRLTNTF